MTLIDSSSKTDRPQKPVTEQIAEDISTGTADRHPSHVMETIRQAVIDAIGNALLGRDTPLGQGYVGSTSSVSDGASVIGGGKGSPVDATFANAGLINALDWDDTIEGGGHPGASVISTALVVGEREETSIPEFLDALIVGYEVSTRVATALRPSWKRYDIVHGSGTRHTIGAAAAAAALENRDVTTTQELLGLAAQLAPVPHAAKFGWDEHRLTWLKDNNARAASAAVRAATLMDEFTGPREALDGDKGFWRMAGSDQCEWNVLKQPLCDPYMIDRLSFKPYPCCRWLHSAVEAVSSAVAEVNEIESIQIETADRVAEDFMIEPINQVNAQFSLPFTVGQAAAGHDKFQWYTEHGPASLPEFDISAIEGPEHTRRFAGSQVVSATATATDVAGESASVTIDQPLGTNERPLDFEESRQKLIAGFERFVDDPRARSDTVLDVLSSDIPVAELIDQLQLT